jgi:SWIM-type zinc finger protein
MASYAKAHDDFTIVDGTHNTTAYNMKLIAFTNVDCLGKSAVIGIVLDQSENSTSVLQALDLFKIGSPGTTLMTDGGSALSVCCF